MRARPAHETRARGLALLVLAACGGHGVRGVPRSTVVARAEPEWSCLRVDHPGEGTGSRAVLALLEDGYIKFAPPARAPAESVCIGLFERASVARATATGLGDDVDVAALGVQALTAGEVAGLPAEARAVAYVSAPISLVGEESSGPVAIESSPDGKTLLLYAQDISRGDLSEGRLQVLNERVGRVETFAAWDFVLTDAGRVFYGSARILHAGDRSHQEPREIDADAQAVAARELGASVSAVKEASFFDRTTGDTEVVALSEYDPGSGRASELGTIGGGSLAVAGGVPVFTRRPSFWELGHRDGGDPSGMRAMAKVDVYAIRGDGETVRLSGGPATVARAAVLAKATLREKALDSGSAMASPRTRQMLSALEPAANGAERAVGDLVIKDGLVERRMGGKVVPVIEGALTALTADRRYAFVRLATGRYVAVHFLP